MIPFLQSPVNFPDPTQANEMGLVGFGGDLEVETLIKAYSKGIFPWFSEEDPFPIWWSPPERMVLVPGQHKVSKSMRQVLNKGDYEFTFDTAFSEVISHCAGVYREEQDGTWITEDMMESYIKLHKAGYAHSAEVWRNGKLIGGLYGVSLGGIFCGESMFSLEANTSKIAFIKLSEWTKNQGFKLIDCQNYTDHLASMGAGLISRAEYLDVLKKALDLPTLQGDWNY